MTFWITVEFAFSASHEVELGEGHLCSSLHEHRFIVQVKLAAPLDRREMVIDFNELDPLADVLASRYDGCYLNDHLSQPTSERIAERLIAELHEAVPATKVMRCSVGVSEEIGRWAWCGDE